MKFLCLKTAFKMTIRISHNCIISVSCLKMQTFVSIQLTCRASETYYKLEIDKTNPMLLTGWYFNVN